MKELLNFCYKLLEELQKTARAVLPELLAEAAGREGAALSARREAAEKKREKLLELAAEGYISGEEFARRDASLARELEALEAQEQSPEAPGYADAAEQIFRQPPGLSARLVRAVVDTLWVYPDREGAARLTLETGGEKRNLRLIRQGGSFCFLPSI